MPLRRPTPTRRSASKAPASKAPTARAATLVAAFEPRKLSLVRAAYAIIAETGFASLRTRDVAQRVGVNVATLHYYFPSKEMLVTAVALYLASQFETLRAPAAGSHAPLQRLRREFADTALYLTDRPDVIAVMCELAGHARHDVAVARTIEPLKRAWQQSVEAIITAGVADGTFSRALSPQAAARVIVALLWGAATFPLDAAELDHARAAVERWLTGPRLKSSRANRPSSQSRTCA